MVEKAVAAFGHIDVLVNNAAHQMTFNSPDEISDEEWDRTLAVNISAMLYLTKAALPLTQRGARSSTRHRSMPMPRTLTF